jgi:hypothetical protein
MAKKSTPKRKSEKRPRSPSGLQQPNALAFTVKGFQALGGPGHTKVYELAKAGVLKIYKDAIGRTLIDGDSGREFLRVKDEATTA